MKFPDRFNRLRQWLGGNIPQFPTFEEQLAREDAERAQWALAVKKAHAERLRPMIERLLLVTDFGNYAKDAHTARITGAVLSDELFDRTMPIGISAHITSSRTARGRPWPTETATRLLLSLQNSSLHVLPNIEVFEVADGQASWLDSIAEATEGTAERANTTLDGVGHIAVVGAMELAFADIDDVFTLPWDNGAMYQLTGLGDQATFDWRLVSADMGP